MSIRGLFVSTGVSVVVEDCDGAGRAGGGDLVGGSGRWGRGGGAEAAAGLGPKDGGRGVGAGGGHFVEGLDDVEGGLDTGGGKLFAKVLAQSFGGDAHDFSDVGLRGAHVAHASDLFAVFGGGVVRLAARFVFCLHTRELYEWGELGLKGILGLTC